jgi:hypothetical protein
MNKISRSLSPKYNGLSIYLSLLAILGGGAIYIMFRNSEPVFFGWIRNVGLGHLLDIVRQYARNHNLLLPEWIIYSLPNGLWAFGYAILISSIWRGSSSPIRYLWLASIPVLVIGYEVLQYPGIAPGIFSIKDLILGAIGLISGIAVGIKPFKTARYENSVM